ncbi:MAG TPA: class I SAM-dependent RNA methyltransferase [Pyrinomonadaceae bacterium]|nr:class I SAM-dependent RNA methyltransferase [Pyrinomonadaceae bacterium]
MNLPINDQTDETLEVVIERMLPGGLGLAHANSRTVMVALAAPGDRLRVRIDRVKGSVSFASIVEVLEPAPVRVEPPCPYFGRCGGCNFQQLSYTAQLAAKIEIIRDCLRRVGGIEAIPGFEITAAPNEWHYRARAQWQYASVRRWLGYFEANSRDVCDVAECAVLVPELQSELESLRAQMTQGDLPDDARYFRAVVGDEEVSVAADVSGRGAGVAGITRTIRDERYHLNANSFFQTNLDLVPALIDFALGDARGETAIELYSGVGLFTLPLARRFANVIAVEDDAAASDFARRNLAEAGLSNTDVVNQDVGDWLDCCDGDVDFLLLDPPRTGAESRVISGIVRLKPKRICYVSCDPATLARDLKKLIAGGYSISSIQAFDMFPQTHHVETVVHLTG